MSAVVGVDVGGTKLLAIRLGDDGIEDEYRSELPGTAAAMIDEILTAVVKLADGHQLQACGVGVAGLVDVSAGAMAWGPHVPGQALLLREELSQALEVPVFVDNDANTTAWAEYSLGAGRGSRAMVMLTLGTGIGGALVLDGRIYRGRGYAGEFGHVRFPGSDEPCDCGRRGCWETEAAGPALERLARQLIASDPAGALAVALGGEAVTGKAITAAASSGNPQALHLVTRVGSALGEGIASVVAMLDPDRIVIGGGLGSIGEVLLGPVREAARRAQYGSTHYDLPDIVGAELGEHAGAVGAGLLAGELIP